MKQSVTDFDRQIRQELANLSDTPPPDSRFDAEKMWTQMRPQLTDVPVRRRAVGWWWAAACVVGLLAVGWVIWPTHSEKRHTPVAAASTRVIPKVIGEQTDNQPELSNDRHRAEIEPTKRRENHNPSQLITAPVTLPQGNGSMPVDTAKAVAMIEAVLLTPVEKPKESIETLMPTEMPTPITRPVVTAPRRRFRVLHVSELAEYDQRQIVEPKIPTEALVQFRLPTAHEFAETEESPWSYLRRTKTNHSLTN